MKQLIAVFFFLFCLDTGYAQSPKVDSLNRLISQAATDTARIKLITKKIGLLTEIDIDAAIKLGLQTIDRAKRIKYKQGEALVRNRLAYCYSFKGDYASAKQNLKLAEAVFVTINDSVQLIKIYNSYGAMYGMQSKYDSAIAFLQKSMTIAEQNADKSELDGIYLNIGISYEMQSNRPQAITYQQKALTLAEAQNDLNTQAYCLINMANTNKLMGDLRQAERRFNQGIKLARQEGIKNVELYAYTNLVDVYNELHETQKAYKFALKAAALAKQVGDQGIEATSLSKASTNLAKQKKFVEAETLDRRAMTLADASRQPLNIHQTYSAMGEILKMQNSYARAIPYYEKSFAVLKNADIYDAQTGESFAELSTCYEKTGNYAQALKAYKTASAIRDSVRGKENIRKATELTMTYEFDKKQQAEQIEQQEQKAVAQARQLALLAGLVLMLLLACVSFYAYQTKRKANTLLQQQKQQLEAQKGQLEEQKRQLQNTLTELQNTQRQLVQAEKMATMGKLTKGIVDRILNPLNYINNFALAAKELLEELMAVAQKNQAVFSGNDQDDLEDTSNMLSQNLAKINQHGNSTARILQDMQKLLKERSSTLITTDINPFLEQHVSSSLQRTLRSSPSLSVDLVFRLTTHPIDINLLPYEFEQVLASLVDNSCYSLREKSRRIIEFSPIIEVNTELISDQVQIQFRDNGRGISSKEQAQLFSPFFTTKPTAQGTGLGLFMGRDVVESMQGQMSIDSVEGEYTQVTIFLPLAAAEHLL